MEVCTKNCQKKDLSLNKQHKLMKKLKKLQINFSVKEGLELSNEPTRILVVKNGGLGNNIKQEDLLPLLQKYGDIHEIIMLPGKQYCFVCFSLETEAEQALVNLNGYLLRQCKDPTQNVVLYLFFVKKAPCSVIPSKELPPGLIIVENFVTEEMESILLQQIRMDSNDIGMMKHRQVRHFGYEFKYGINNVDVSDPLPEGIPECCQDFLNKAIQLGLVQHFPDQLTVNQYKPGQGIPAHVDTTEAFEDGIMSLSLGSQVVMDFRHPDGKHLKVFLPRQSLLVMTGESRYVWSHGITPRKSDIVLTPNNEGLTLVKRDTRTSFTFRKVIKDRKTSSAGSSGVPLYQTSCQALELEKEHVHNVYNNIANHFSGTRYKPWPKVVEFLTEQPSFSFLADVGCGNGKYLGTSKHMYEVGSDYSCNLATICRGRGFEACVADVTCLPFRSSTFDVVLCIAVIHHMATEERRVKAVSEIIRILSLGGRALIYVWALEQEVNQKQSKYINSKLQKKLAETNGNFATDDENCFSNKASQTASEVESSPYLCDAISGAEPCSRTNCSQHLVLGSLPVHQNRTHFKEQDVLVPWQLKTKQNCQSDDSQVSVKSNVFHRFYHVFKQGELEALCQQVPGCAVSRSYYDQGNWCVVVEKTVT